MASRRARRSRAPLLGALFVNLTSACATTGVQPAATGMAGAAPSPQLTKYVNPFIGTGAALRHNAVENGAGGSVFPGATVPFGMVQWSPDTPNARPSGYDYADDRITGFSLTHFSGAGCPNNEDVPVLPVLPGAAGPARFSHEQERASAGYYAVTFESGVRVELTAALRSGAGRFTFPRAAGDVLIGPVKHGSLHAARRAVSGETSGGPFCQNSQATYRLYFYAIFDQDFRAAEAGPGSLRLSFSGSTAPVVMRVGVSYVSVANARENLEAELARASFDALSAAAAAAWNERLNTVRVTGGSELDKTKFYTALYHALLHPNVFNDANGEYIGFDGRRHRVAKRHHYANFSMWDTYRSQIQLLALLFPEETSDIVQSLVDDAAQCGYLPLWPQNNIDYKVMVGDPAALLIANAFAFGARGFDAKRALDILLHPPNDPNAACGYPDVLAESSYTELGYLVPSDVHNGKNWGATSTTLEYAARDFAVAELATALGNGADARRLFGRARAWRNVLEDGGLPQSRLEDGAWKQPLNAPSGGYNRDYVEGNAEQYTWMVPFDASALVAALGGRAAVVPRLDRFFSVLNAGGQDPNFYMGNEPSFGTPWLYNWALDPARTEDVVRRIVERTFATSPSGLPGNDDLGALSSWLVWAMLGIYPAVPGVSGFTTAAPVFPSVRLVTADHRVLELERAGDGHVRALSVNGVPAAGPWFTFDPQRSSTKLVFALGHDARSWTAPGFQPYTQPSAFASFRDALDATGVGKDGAAGSADFDGHGHSYSELALGTAGIRPAGLVEVEGRRLEWPSGELDHVVCSGQTVHLAAPVRARKWLFLGAANHGPSAGTVVFTAADGSQRAVTLELPDWTLDGERDPLPPGVHVLAKTAYRLDRAGKRDPTPAYVFARSVDLGSPFEVASLTFPARVSRGRLHVFAHAPVP